MEQKTLNKIRKLQNIKPPKEWHGKEGVKLVGYGEKSFYQIIEETEKDESFNKDFKIFPDKTGLWWVVTNGTTKKNQS